MSSKQTFLELISKITSELGWSDFGPKIKIERPARREHGDFSSNVAMVLSKDLGKPPREVAQIVVDEINRSGMEHLERAEVAGPGFVNVFLKALWLQDVLKEVVVAGRSNWAADNLGQGEKVQIEFVSANPTGPIHVGNGWWASYGDSLARILSRCGWDVSKEYYVNDTGGQIRRLGESLLARKKGEIPSEDGYQGEYVTELANQYQGPMEITEAGRFAAERILEGIKDTLKRIGVEFDSWYSQASIEEGGAVQETIETLRASGLVYDNEGAIWLASSTLGDTRDRVLVKSNGDVTYTGGDLAYHRDKFLVRGFERVIDIFGADHHGQVATLKAGVKALNIDPEKLEIKLGQMISLVGGAMSKRSGNFVSLDSLLDEIGPDAMRLMSLINSIDQATVLDIDLVKKTTSENPVYYVQYAYARISSIFRKASAQ